MKRASSISANRHEQTHASSIRPFKINFVRMKTSLKILVLILVTLTVISCRPFSKESYLEKYDKFISEVSEKSASYTDKDWEKADEKFKKFNTDWYDHFKEDLTLKEKLTTTKYNVQYSYYKAMPQAMDLFNTYLKGDYEKVKERIKYYKENKMDKDIDALLKLAKESGESSLNKIKEIINEVDKEINNNLLPN